MIQNMRKRPKYPKRQKVTHLLLQPPVYAAATTATAPPPVEATTLPDEATALYKKQGKKKENQILNSQSYRDAVSPLLRCFRIGNSHFGICICGRHPFRHLRNKMNMIET